PTAIACPGRTGWSRRRRRGRVPAAPTTAWSNGRRTWPTRSYRAGRASTAAPAEPARPWPARPCGHGDRGPAAEWAAEPAERAEPYERGPGGPVLRRFHDPAPRSPGESPTDGRLQPSAGSATASVDGAGWPP